MKDLVKLWGWLASKTYSAVNTNTETPEVQRSPENTKKSKSILGIAFIGTLGILAAVFILLVHPYDMIYKWKLVFGDGGEIFELWRKPPVDVYLKVYLFNVTNKDAFLRGEEKLKVEEVGPYVYKELMMHDNVTFNDNGTLTAVPRHPLVWVPELSEGRREDDQLTMINIALLSIADVVKDASYFTRLGLNMVIRQTNSEPLVQMTAKEFMFGYQSALMTLGNSFMPNWIYFDKVGLIDRMYDFEGDYETIYTGEDELPRAGLIDTYRGSKKIPQWNAPCGYVNGSSDGTKFPGNISPNDTLYFYRRSMCRAKPLVKINERVSSGFDGYVYTFPDDIDDNGRRIPENSCFCNDESNCLPEGLLDVRGCYYGFPIALSYPHFYKADRQLVENIEGSRPEKEKHESYFVIEPQSGLPLELAVRYQINMALGNIDSIANVKEFSNMVLPLLWTEISLKELPTNLMMRFILYIKVLPVAEQVLMVALFLVGTLMLTLSVYRCSKRTNGGQTHVPYMDEELAYIDRKLSDYLPKNRRDLHPKELEVLRDVSVVTFEEFQKMREDDI